MKDTNKVFPYTAWRLTPSFKPVKCEVLAHGTWWAGNRYLELSTGRQCSPDDIYSTKADAIAAGRAKVEVQAIALAKKRANLDKKIAALNKAETT